MSHVPLPLAYDHVACPYINIIEQPSVVGVLGRDSHDNQLRLNGNHEIHNRRGIHLQGDI